MEGGHDDGIKELNEGRFLRPPQDPEEFWKRIPLDYEAGEKQHWRDYTGTRDSMPAGENRSRRRKKRALDRFHSPDGARGNAPHATLDRSTSGYETN